MPCNPFPDCQEYCDNRKQIVLQDKGQSVYIASNESGKLICVVRIDDCVIKQGERCDYLLLDCTNTDPKAYFVELKGSDLLKAVDQINTTIDILIGKLQGRKFFGRIVLTKTYSPALTTVKYMTLKTKLKKLGGNLLQRSIKLEEKI